MNRTRVLLLAGILLACWMQQAIGAGERTNIRGMGMARTSIASSHSLEAVGVNPANLMAPDDATVTFSLIPVGLHVGSDFLTYGMYNEFFTGVESSSGRVAKHLTDADKQKLLDAFNGGVGGIEAEAEVRPIGLALRFDGFATFAVTVTEQVHATAKIPSEYVRFLLYGNTPGSTYDLGQTAGSVSWTREYAFSSAVPLPEIGPFHNLSAGASLKLVHGFGYYELSRCATSLVTGTDGILNGNIDVFARGASADLFQGGANFSPFPAPAGSGIGVDLGVAGEWNDYLRLGAAVTDIGSIEWTRNLKEKVAQGSIHLDNPMSQAQRDSIQNAVRGEERDGQPFSTSLPTMLRLGASVELHKVKALKKFLYGEMTVACDFNQLLVSRPGIPGYTRVSVGMEYRPWKFLPIRTGYSMGGADRSSFALGFGLHAGFFELDLASENLSWLFSQDNLSYGSVAVGMKLRF